MGLLVSGRIGRSSPPNISRNVTFDNSDSDIALLTALGGIASFAGGPFIAAADPKLIGCQDLTKQVDYREWNEIEKTNKLRWQALRKSVVAPWIGLVLPRVLLRLPYGEKTDPIDAFQFEELTSNEQHELLLWGNAAFYSAVLIARTFTMQGWQMRLGEYMEISDLPAYIQRFDDITELKPCAEVCINDQTVEKILQQGIMPFISHRNANLIRLARFESIAEPLLSLRAAWN
ncbi:MAG: type VI secretion system contractile sheath domain-containing protein [Methylococcaceae bacterium]